MSKPDQVPLKFELSSAEDDDRYVIDSRIEIVFILRAIMRRNTLVTIYFNRGNDFILTSILGIDAERGQMVVEYDAKKELNQPALVAEKLIFIASHDQVKVQFVSRSIEKTRFEGRDAFSIGIPESLLRVQRREYYRITTPAVNPLKCTIPMPAGHQPASVEVILLDISCGGIAVIDHPHKIDFTPGTIYRNCRIDLPGIGTVTAALKIKTIFDVTLKNGVSCKRCGCGFVAMPENMLAMIQRYIMKLEREKKARETRLE